MVEFYKLMRVAMTSDEKKPNFKVFEYDKPLLVDSPAVLSSASFVDSDFVYMPGP